MTWHLTFLLIDLGCLAALVLLFRGAPDWIQRSAIAWLGVGFLILSCGRFGALIGEVEAAARVIEFGRSFCHIGVIAYILRLFIAEQARRCLPSSSQLFPR